MNPSFELFLQEHRAGLPAMSEQHGIAAFPMSRRRLMRRGAAVIVGVTAAGLLPVGSNKADAAVPLLVRVAFGAAVGWVVEKTLDHLYDRYVAARPTVVATQSRPTNGREAFHDAHASELAISGFSTGEEMRQSPAVSAQLHGHIFAVPSDLRHQRYGLSCHDLNRAEAILLHTLYADSCVGSIPLPVSLRQAGTNEDAELLTGLLRREGFSACGFTLEYKRSFSTLKKQRSTAYCLSHVSLPEKRSLLFV